MAESYWSNKLRFTILFTVCATVVIVMILAMLTTRLINGDHENTQRDRIAACVKSNDVVGCMNAGR